jgi:hypothetical protein
VRPSLMSDMDCALVVQIPLSDIEEGECWGLELLHFFAIEARINHGNLSTPRDLICFGHKSGRSMGMRRQRIYYT